MQRRDVIREIVNREMLGKQVTEVAVARDAKELHDIACRLFGTWETALLYSGVDIFKTQIQSRCRYSPEEVISALRQICIRMQNLTLMGVRHWDGQLQLDAVRQFGTWRKALIAAGINPRTVNNAVRALHIDHNTIINYLLKRDRKGLSLAWHDICYENRPIIVAARYLFERWESALEAAGISVDDRLKDNSPPFNIDPSSLYSHDDVIKRIRWMCLNKQNIKSDHVRRLDFLLHGAACQLFGTWERAVLVAGININRAFISLSEQQLNHSDVITAIQQRNRQGLSLKRCEVLMQDRLLVLSALHNFKSWASALEVSGVASGR